MVRNDTHKRSAAEQPKKSDTPGASTGKGQAGSEALSLYPAFKFMQDGKEIDLSGYKMEWTFYRLPEVSGLRMARRV